MLRIITTLFYDLTKDPHENYNIAGLNPDLIATLSDLLGKGADEKRNSWRKFVD
ncbi:MAG: hypothetical protein LC662_11435 [Rhodothermaceae bacterium]|nr:hypothetical protein [Rhodothermaceae bacterium]